MVGGLTREFNVGKISADLDGNGIIDIADVTIVALAFYSEPGDSLWNPIADLDGNNIIDIVDITMVAIHFGQTV
jgi:hypothetical protein